MCGRNTVGKKWRSGPIKTGKTRVEKHSGQNTGVNAVLGRETQWLNTGINEGETSIVLVHT